MNLNNPPSEDNLIRHSLVILAITQVAVVCNLLFQMMMGRVLSPEEYGVMASMLGVITIVFYPIESVRTAVAHYSSRLIQEGHVGEIKLLVWRWILRVSAVTMPAGLLGILFSRPLAHFFNIPTAMPIILTSFTVAIIPLLPIFIGALQGVQSFVWMSFVMHGWTIVRLSVAAILVYSFKPVAELGLAGQAASIVFGVFFGFAALRIALGPKREPGVRPRGVAEYLFRSLVILCGFAVLMNADIILVKHYFAPAEAGYFARAGTIGRALIYLPMPIAMAMFPKVTSGGGISAHNWMTLIKALAFSALLVGIAVLACTVWPQWALLILFNDRNPTPEMTALLQRVVWAMAPLGLTYLVMNFELAQHRFKPALALIPCAIGYLVGVTLFHRTVLQVVAILATMSSLSMILLILGLPWKKGKG